MSNRSSIVLAGLLVLAACGRGGPVPHHVLDANSEPLRTAFDADTGKVRALFLASPT